MSFFDKFKSRPQSSQPSQPSQPYQAYEPSPSYPNNDSFNPFMLNLEKSKLDLNKTIDMLNLDKGVDLHNITVRVGYVGDYSGSMNRLYHNGEVQKTVQRIFPLALKFDDNGELDSWIFDDSFHRMDGVVMENFSNYVEEHILSKHYHMGCTEYAPVLEDVIQKYFVEDSEVKTPVFLIFLTDGNNSDQRAAEKIIQKSAQYPIFIQFVGIGTESFSFLEKLDNLSGRPCDNTGFIKVEDLKDLSDLELYNKLLEQFPDWLKETGIL